METFLTDALKEKYKQLADRCRAVLFSAPCGFGKSCAARALAGPGRTMTLSAREPGFSLPSLKEKWNTLILDDLEELEDEGAQQALCGLLRSCRSHRVLLLSRGPLPGWLLPFQTTGVLGVLTAQDLLLDRGTADKLLQAHGVYLSASELAAIHKETNGYPLALELLAQHLERGEAFAAATSDAVRQEIFYYYEEAVFRRMEKATRHLLMELSLFETVTPELARIVTGDPHANERLAGLLRQTSMMHLEKLGNYTFWPIFRRFLQWELDQKYTSDQRCTLWDRGALYYELNEDYGSALEFYTQSGNKAKVADLLVKNAGLHPGMGHYLEMEPYYRALPEAEVRENPALMQAMSMLCALEMDYAGSERWYAALKEYRARAAGADAREARSRLAWLDIGLPQRGVEGLTELFPRVFTLIKNREISLPAFSVTSTLPSLMNGGKDFSPWSKRDTLLYRTLRLPVEAALGKDGVGLADCALAESLFEKGEDVRNQAMKLLAMLEHIRREGTPDMEFAVVGLLARVQIDAGRAQDARESLLDLRERFIRQEQTRFLPNLDAFVCRIDLLQGNDAAVALWYRDKAPRNPQYLQTLKRYQYFTQAMAQLALGDPQGAQVTLAPLEPYCQLCRRHIDGISLNLLRAVAEYRQNSPDWKPRLAAALDAAREFGFVRTVSQYGGAVLPLLEHTSWDADPSFLAQVVRKARRQGAYYPQFLSPAQQMEAPLSETERQVLQLLCAGKSNAEIGQALHIKLPTVKTHVSHVLKKLKISRRTQVRDAAQRLHFIDR